MSDTAALDRKYGEMSIAELTSRAKEMRHDFSELHEGERGDDYSQKARSIRDEFEVLDTHLAMAYAQEARQAAATPDAATNVVNSGIRSIGERIVENEALAAMVDGGWKSDVLFTVEGSLFAGQRAIIGEWGNSGPPNAPTNDANSLLTVGQPIPPIPREAHLFVRDLIPVMPTTLTQVPYVRELTPTAQEGAATAVAEGAVKPDVTLGFDPQIAYITVIAGNVSPSRQLWSDAPLVVAYINQRLPYLVKFAENAEILNGSGTYPDILGLLRQTGVQSQNAVSGETAITLADAIAKVENVDGAADGVVMNPTDAWAMFAKRAAGGSGTFDAGTPFSAAAFATVWGCRVVRSRTITAGTALVGDFAHGAAILDREQVNVQVYPQHSDYAARNAVLVQAEERVGLMVPRPDLFVKTTIS